MKETGNAQGIWGTFDSSWAHCAEIANALNQLEPSYKASAEIGGGGSVYVHATLDADRWMWWGTVNENWGCDVLDTESGEPLNVYIEAEVSTEEADAQKVADAIHMEIIEFRRRQGSSLAP